MKITYISRYFKNKKVAILGFGREGQSTYRVLRACLPDLSIAVCDRSSDESMFRHEANRDEAVRCFFGPHYLQGLSGADIIVRTPGIPFREMESFTGDAEVTSQTAVFLSLFHKQVIGITGTKGKSTTASLLFHMFRDTGRRTLLAGNIGVPPFELLSDMDESTLVVMELSSHQLEHLQVSPHIAVLLNIFEEHLDHYASFLAYQQAKLNIARWQQADDYLIVNQANPFLNEHLKTLNSPATRIWLGHDDHGGYAACFSGDDLVLRLPGCLLHMSDLAAKRKISGRHNLINIAAAAAAAALAGLGEAQILAGTESFHGLPHRLECAGVWQGKTFINDSISTIPESTIAALQTYPQTGALILGGFDRGVDYAELMNFIAGSAVRVIVFTGPAGRRMYEMAGAHEGMKNKMCMEAGDFSHAFHLAANATGKGEVCLLSPAAASYDAFRDFAERGEAFKKMVSALGNV